MVVGGKLFLNGLWTSKVHCIYMYIYILHICLIKFTTPKRPLGGISPQLCTIYRVGGISNLRQLGVSPAGKPPDRSYYISMCIYIYIWVFPKIGVSQNGWFIMETPIKVDDLGVPLFLETPIYIKYIQP